MDRNLNLSFRARQPRKPRLLASTVKVLNDDQKQREDPKLWVCFVRKLCSLYDFAFQFSVPITEVLKLNPDLGQFASLPSGATILIPGNGEDVPVPLSPHRVEDFNITPLEDGVQPSTFHEEEAAASYLDGSWYPPHPPFHQADKEKAFGRFEYEDDPKTGPDNIKILHGWANEHVRSVEIPQLKGMPAGTHHSQGHIQFFKKAHDQVRALFDAWEKARLIKLIHTWDGAFNPRYQRKAPHDRKHISNHAWGTAFDINAKWNKIGHAPARCGQPGSVFELVEIAYQNGFYWGGHFGAHRNDGMHFEVAHLG